MASQRSLKPPGCTCHPAPLLRHLCLQTLPLLLTCSAARMQNKEHHAGLCHIVASQTQQAQMMLSKTAHMCLGGACRNAISTMLHVTICEPIGFSSLLTSMSLSQNHCCCHSLNRTAAPKLFLELLVANNSIEGPLQFGLSIITNPSPPAPQLVISIAFFQQLQPVELVVAFTNVGLVEHDISIAGHRRDRSFWTSRICRRRGCWLVCA